MANGESDGGYAPNAYSYACYNNCRRAFWKISICFIDHGACARVIDFHEERCARSCHCSIGRPGSNEEKGSRCNGNRGSGR